MSITAGTPTKGDGRTKLSAFYEDKTAAILRRYGPGPKVHYHTGFMTIPPADGVSIQELRSSLVASQERVLDEASAVWQIGKIPFRDVLDVGCGLGGGSIFWAQQFGANVTAITIAPSHLDLVAGFAMQAGVESRVQPLLSDALLVPGESCYDAAVAIDSSSSFERGPWFRRLSGILRPAGRVLIFDCFLEDLQYREAFNQHWCAQIGTVNEYLAEAGRAGFRRESIVDVSSQTLPFWYTTIALITAEVQERSSTRAEQIRLNNSLHVHSLVRRGVRSGGLRHVLMSFVRV
jgi:cyclopropane fatty-acyl-phospholipid synthase-like methyltransferase